MSWRLLALLACVDDGATKQRDQERVEYNCFCFPAGGEDEAVFIPDGEREREMDVPVGELTANNVVAVVHVVCWAGFPRAASVARE